ncbi:MAG: ABC transporter substrate-binding protein [Propionibacteriales bacterium]|nr:ABC transporter substrate-binding protein [Propionibacteriales bacterium]
MINSSLSRRSLLGGLAVAGAVGLGLTGCGAPGGNAGGSDRTSAYKQADVDVPQQYQGRTVVLFWSPWTGDPFAAIGEMCRRFNESQSDIVVVTESMAGYEQLNQKLTAGLQARAVPDIVAFPELQWLQFHFNGVFAELDPYFTDTWNLSVYMDEYVKEGMAGGKTYLVPFARSTPLFYFNKNAYAKAGLPETGPRTWNQLAEFAPELAKVQVSGKPLKAMAFSAKDSWPGQAGIWAFGGNYSRDWTITIGDEPGISWLEWQRAFIHQSGFGYLAKDAPVDFSTGLAAGCHQSTAALADITKQSKFDVGAAFMLGQQTEQTNCPTGGSGLSVVKSDSEERQAAAVEFLKFCADPEIAAFWHKATGYVPIVKASHDTATVKNLVKQNPNYQVALQQLKNARTADQIGWFQSGALDISAAMARVYGDNVPAATAIGEVAPKLQKVFDDNRSRVEKAGVSV